ncbi:KPN_02809 family neutral zinc metallopeptidase [Nakamurella lactea]|uniref:KPN_02809 family neutral zinc metallopeptidase n=1 Tax=Nakamurella lactea TaxID=459515 RepID=UPI00048B4156
MKFNEGASLNTGQISDQRGSSGGGGGGLGGGGLGGIPIGKAGGGIGLVVAIVLIAIQLFGGKFGGGSDTGSASGGSSLLQQAAATGDNVDASALASECRTGADANAKDDCRVVGFVNSIQDYWANQFKSTGKTYPEATTVFYSQAVSTGCGQGSSGMGPFYCPADNQVYIDLSFWQDLKTQFGTNGGVFAEGYVLAHEYGHHIQALLGTSDRVGSDSGPTSGSVRLELQADCYAGVWAKNATSTPGADGQILISDITDQDISDALDTASKIGDDYIQTHLGSGRSDPSQYTHGTSAQREKWFRQGFSTGDPAQCDTFGAKDLG